VRRSLRRRTTLGGRRTKASVEQQRKVAGLVCLVCGRGPVDPAHLVPQRLGGCGDRDCVVPLCRAHHRLYDRARLRLAPYLGEQFAIELSHALGHVGAPALADALGGAGWPAPWSEAIDNEEEDDERQRHK
jgi:hypothetical protein